MDYYQRKLKTIELIHKLGMSGSATREDIAYHVKTIFGMGDSFVQKHIDDELERGELTIDKRSGKLSGPKK